MKIHSISVTGFGVWDALKLEDLSHSINVLYGRNEAGKTTLMQFLRAMFYGTAADGRSRYLQADAPQGCLEVETRTGIFEIVRGFRVPSRRGESVSDRVAVASQGAAPQGAHALQVLLSGVDEAIYRNVYAIGLREMQELGALSDTGAANYLYDLSAGLDRVSLVDVLRRLRRARESLVNTGGAPCEIGSLLQHKERIEEELDELAESHGRYRTLATERSRLALQVVKMQEELEFLTCQARHIELACALREKWHLFQAVSGKRKKMGRVLKVTGEDRLQIEGLAEKNSSQQRMRKRMQSRRAQCREQIAALPIRTDLARQGARIEALEDQRPWIESIVNQIATLEREADELEAGVVAADAAGGESPPSSFAVAAKAREKLPQLREFARALKQSRTQLVAENRRLREASNFTVPLEAQQAPSLAEQLEEATTRNAELQRRIQLEERLQKMADQRRDLDLFREGLWDQKVLSPKVLIVSGGLFAFGVMLVFAGIFLSQATGFLGPAVSVVGFVGAGAGVWLKRTLQKGHEREFDACERQQTLLSMQENEAIEECRQLDESLPTGQGPHAVQLRQTEKEVACLQQEFDRDHQNQRIRKEAAEVESAAAEAKSSYQRAVRQWHRAVHDVGLPANLSPAGVRRLATSSRTLAVWGEQAERLRATANERRSELSAVAVRIDALLEAVGQASPESELLDKVDFLVDAWSAQRRLLRRRSTLRRKVGKNGQRLFRVARELSQLQKQRRDLFSVLGMTAADEPQELAERYAESQRHERECKQLDAEMNTATTGICDRAQLDEELAGVSAEQLERRRDRNAKKLEKMDLKLKDAFERRGRLGEQLLSLGNDRRDAMLKLELASIEKKLGDAVGRWKHLAVTTCLLESIRRCYEQQRQPAALQEASLYVERLTEGRYVRIWTRLDEESLCVDDAQGRPWSLDSLSRGTREQLFLALRLSLVTQYAQRGIRLPLVLDDVLVNFDMARANAAARVLRDFASLGHQIFVFTCHEHLVKIFKSIKASVRELPAYEQPQATEQPLSVPTEEAAEQENPEDADEDAGGEARNQAA